MWLIAPSLRCSSLYEQDEANVFAEPSVMSVHVLPYLLQMAEKYSQSSSLARSLNSWAQDNAAQVVDGLAVCKEVQPGATLACQTPYTYSCIFVNFQCYNSIIYSFYSWIIDPLMAGSPCGPPFPQNPVWPVDQGCLPPPTTENI